MQKRRWINSVEPKEKTGVRRDGNFEIKGIYQRCFAHEDAARPGIRWPPSIAAL